MAISVEAILADAQRLVLRLKEHDNSADCLITRTQSLQKQLDAMKQVHCVCIITWVSIRGKVEVGGGNEEDAPPIFYLGYTIGKSASPVFNLYWFTAK